MKEEPKTKIKGVKALMEFIKRGMKQSDFPEFFKKYKKDMKFQSKKRIKN